MIGTVKSRTEHSAQNVTYAAISRSLAMLMGFVSRVVFTHTLSQEYVGVNGLFYDILNVFSLTELGLSTAVAYALYKPIAKKDFETQKTLLQFYKKFYYAVAFIVLVLGACIIPFLGVLIKNQPDVSYLTVIYLMFLANSVFSYFWSYKKTLLDAHQLNYIGTLTQTISWIVQIVIQIIILITTRNYMLYLSIMLLSTLISNYVISKFADKRYPYIREKGARALTKEEKKDIFSNMKAIILHKIGDVAVNNTDNLLISSIIGIVAAGIYSNYYLIIVSVRGIYLQIFQGIAGSVGNLGVVEDKNRIKKIFEALFFFGQWLYGMTAICMYEVLDIFVDISFGSNYVFTGYVTLVLCVDFYLSGLCQASLLFRDSLGLFYYDRYKSIATAIINLSVSIVLGNLIGIEGIFIGTFVSTILTSLWVEPYILYKKRLKEGLSMYFVKMGIYMIVTLLLGIGCHYICSFLTGNKITLMLLRFIISVVFVNACYFLLFFRTKEYKLLKDKAYKVIRKKLSRC